MEKKLYRIKEGRKLVGVCGGIAEYFQFDPTIIRLLWVLAAILWGSGLIAYIVCAFLIPEKPDDFVTIDK